MTRAEFDWSTAEPVELTVSSIFAPGQTATNLIEDWMEAVTEATEGAVTFDYYESATLHPAPEGLSAMTSGLTDITFAHNGYFPDQLPIANWDDLVVRYRARRVGYPNVNIAGIGSQLLHYTDDSVARAEQREAGFVPLLPMLSGPSVHVLQGVLRPRVAAGRQVRVPDAIVQDEVEALGMIGVSLRRTSSTRRCSAACSTARSTPSPRFTPQICSPSHRTPAPPFGPSTGSNWVVSTSTWDELIPEIQQVLMDARYEQMETFATTTLDEYRDLVDAAEAAGGGIIDAAEINPPIAEYWADRPDLVETAPAGLADPEASIERTNGVAQAWLAFSVDELEVPASTDDILDALAAGAGVVQDWDAWTAALADGLGAE